MVNAGTVRRMLNYQSFQFVQMILLLRKFLVIFSSRKLEELLKIRKKYLYHRYQIQQDRLLWPKILDVSIPVFHMEYSENLQFAAKKEAQSAHFNKVSTLLHCTVIHEKDEEGMAENKYVYHFSDNTTHDASHNFCVIKDLIYSFYPDIDIVRLKSDNCSTQYKSRHVFFRYKKLSAELGKTILIAYLPTGILSMKQNRCICDHCKTGHLYRCVIEPGKIKWKSKRMKNMRLRLMMKNLRYHKKLTLIW